MTASPLLKITLKSGDAGKNVELQWSGANNPLWLIEADTNLIKEIKADKQPIGKFIHKNNFTTHQINLKKNSRVYLFTDGFADQFGGEKGKKFKYKQLEELFVKSHHLSPIEQVNQIEKEFSLWKKDSEQVDDVCIVSLKL